RAVIEAGRGRYATSLYVGGRAPSDATLANADQLVALVTEPTVLIGEVRADDRFRLEGNSNVRVAPRAASVRRAGCLAELGWRLAQSGVPGDPIALDAVYVT